MQKILLGLFTLLFAAGPLLAQDTIKTKSGATLTGRIIKIDSGTVEMETEYAGMLKIKQAEITGMKTGSGIFIRLGDGNRLMGVIEETGDGGLLVDAGNIQAETTVGEVKSAWVNPEDDPERPMERKWKYQIAAGFSGKTGNSEAKSLDLDAKATLKGENDQLDFYGRYRFGEVDGSKDVDESKGGMRYKRDIASHFLWYVRAELGRDDIKDQDLYTQAAGGIGYKFLEEDNHSLELLTGLAHRFESFTDGTSSSFAALDLSLLHDYTWGWGSIDNSINYTQSFQEMNDYIVTHESAVEFPIADSDSWKFRAGIENEYDGSPAAGNTRLDTYYFSQIVYSFE